MHLLPSSNRFYFLLLILFFLMSGCIKTSLPSNNNSNNQPVSTPVGTPTGNMVSKLIGPSGGAITSDDSAIELIIPANALSTNTTITVQQITNNCPGGISTYRFGPNGLQFSQPASLKFHYTANILNKTLGDLMGIGYQDSSGYWHRLKQFTNDTAQKILTATVKHFTDYAPFTVLAIDPAAATVRPGNTLGLQVQVAYSDDDDLPPLPGSIIPDIEADPYIIVYQEGKCNWEINGGQHTADFGQFVSDNGTLSITYEAPIQVPQTGNPVAVSATIDMGGMKFNGKKYNKTILVSNIKISENLVFLIDIEMDDNGTGESGSGSFTVDYKDGVTFKLTMVYATNQGVDTAIFSDIANRGPDMEPTSHMEGSSSSGATYTWQPDPNGEINIVSGSGIGIPEPQDENITLSFNGEGTYPKWQTVICAYNGCTTSYAGGNSSANFPYGMQFKATNDPQKLVLISNVVTGNPVLTATITPQH